MSEFTSFYSEAVQGFNNGCSKAQGSSTQGKPVRCRYCLSEVHVHESSDMAHCEKCGNSFSVAPGTKYSLDLDSIKKMSGKQLYEASFFDGKVIVPFLALSASKGYLKALLLMAGYWEHRNDQSEAEAFYRLAAEQSPEGKAAYLLYQFRQEPEPSEYPDLLFELDQCLKEPFYTIDPNECRDIFDKREQAFLQYCKDESAKRIKQRNEELDRLFWERSHPFAEEDAYVDDGFYQAYAPAEKANDDGADWNGMPWTANHINAIGV